MHVRGFTQHVSSNSAPAHRGGFLGVVDKVDHLIRLGVNAVELLPVFEFDENAYKRNAQLFNFWGYSSEHFFSPMGRYQH